MPHDACRIGTRLDGLTLKAPVYLSRDDRRRHAHVVGQTGTGKSTLLQSLIFEDLHRGAGCAVIEPLGGLAEIVVDAVPASRNDQTIYFAPGQDLEYVVGLNVLDRVPVDRRPLVANHVLAAVLHIWGASLDSAPRMSHLIYCAVRLLLDTPGSTLLGLPRLLVNDRYRAELVESCLDPVVSAFWEEEFAHYDERFREQVIAPVQNKLGLIFAQPALRNVLGQPHSTVDLARLMNGGGILIANLAKGYLGETGSHLLGALLATSLMQVAEERAQVPPEQRCDFTLVVDEVHNFATSSFASGLAELRQQNLAIVASHQHLAQLSPIVRDALIGNCGSKIVFRVGAQDARTLAAELDIDNERALLNTPNFHAWCRLLQHGVPSDAFMLETELQEPPAVGRKQKVIAHTRARHCRPRATVEAMIAKQIIA